MLWWGVSTIDIKCVSDLNFIFYEVPLIYYVYLKMATIKVKILKLRSDSVLVSTPSQSQYFSRDTVPWSATIFHCCSLSNSSIKLWITVQNNCCHLYHKQSWALTPSSALPHHRVKDAKAQAACPITTRCRMIRKSSRNQSQNRKCVRISIRRPDG